MPSRLFVGNLSFNIAESELSEFCTSRNVQTASIKIMRDMESGRSRGFGFIELKPESDMEAAIKELNGQELDGRALTVNEARPPKKREFGGHGGPRFDHPRSDGGGGGRRFGGRDSRRKGKERPKRKIQELY